MFACYTPTKNERMQCTHTCTLRHARTRLRAQNSNIFKYILIYSWGFVIISPTHASPVLDNWTAHLGDSSTIEVTRKRSMSAISVHSVMLSSQDFLDLPLFNSLYNCCGDAAVTNGVSNLSSFDYLQDWCDEWCIQTIFFWLSSGQLWRVVYPNYLLFIILRTGYWDKKTILFNKRVFHD